MPCIFPREISTSAFAIKIQIVQTFCYAIFPGSEDTASYQEKSIKEMYYLHKKTCIYAHVWKECVKYMHVCVSLSTTGFIQLKLVHLLQAWILFIPSLVDLKCFQRSHENKWEHLRSRWAVVFVGPGEFRGRKPAIDQLTIRCHLHGWKCWQGGKLDTGRNWAANKPCVKPWNKKCKNNEA